MSRVLAVGGLLAGFAALYLAVASALGSARSAGPVCTAGGPREEIRYRTVASGLRGTAGCDVRAVIVRLSGGGAVWSTPHAGVFDARVPAGLEVRAVVKVLADGSRQRFAVTATN